MLNRVNHLDEAILDELQEVMEDDFELLIRTFIKDSALHLENIEACVRNQSYDQLRRAAHSLKGSSVNVGANQLHMNCAELEKAASEQWISQIGSLVDQVEREYQAVVLCLHQKYPFTDKAS